MRSSTAPPGQWQAVDDAKPPWPRLTPPVSEFTGRAVGLLLFTSPSGRSPARQRRAPASPYLTSASTTPPSPAESLSASPSSNFVPVAAIRSAVLGVVDIKVRDREHIWNEQDAVQRLRTFLVFATAELVSSVHVAVDGVPSAPAREHLAGMQLLKHVQNLRAGLLGPHAVAVAAALSALSILDVGFASAARRPGASRALDSTKTNLRVRVVAWRSHQVTAVIEAMSVPL
nr:uncharacterized protein LOC127303429 [Lolium perenne]